MSLRSDRIRNIEPQTCPSRFDECGPWERKAGIDHWQLGRWAATRDEADAEVAEYAAQNPNGSMGDPMWKFSGEQPRTCSFCGGVHPDDAVALINVGWRFTSTGKSYKRYLEPPVGQGHPLPPAKLYVIHFNEAQIAAFNAALDSQRLADATKAVAP